MRFKSSHVGHCYRLLQRSEELFLTLVSSLGLATNFPPEGSCTRIRPLEPHRGIQVSVSVFFNVLLESWSNDAATKARPIPNNDKRRGKDVLRVLPKPWLLCRPQHSAEDRNNTIIHNKSQQNRKISLLAGLH